MMIRNEPRSKLRKFHNVNIKVRQWNRSWVTSIHLEVSQPGSLNSLSMLFFPHQYSILYIFTKCSKQNSYSSFFPFLLIYYSQPFDPTQFSAILCRITKWLNSCRSPLLLQIHTNTNLIVILIRWTVLRITC